MPISCGDVSAQTLPDLLFISSSLPPKLFLDNFLCDFLRCFSPFSSPPLPSLYTRNLQLLHLLLSFLLGKKSPCRASTTRQKFPINYIAARNPLFLLFPN